MSLHRNNIQKPPSFAATTGPGSVPLASPQRSRNPSKERGLRLLFRFFVFLIQWLQTHVLSEKFSWKYCTYIRIKKKERERGEEKARKDGELAPWLPQEKAKQSDPLHPHLPSPPPSLPQESVATWTGRRRERDLAIYLKLNRLKCFFTFATMEQLPPPLRHFSRYYNNIMMPKK